MGARGSKSRRSELPEGRPMRSFHEALVREHDLRHDFDDIFEICDCIGQGGLCSIYKIRKKDDQIGGSSRPEHVRRRMHIRKYSAPLPRALSNKGFPLAMSLNERFLSQDPSSESNAAGPTNMHFALKVINLAMVKEDKIDQLKNEIEILKTLDHKNIIKAFETFQMRANKKLMIVMELCTGGDLFARLPYSERHATVCIKQILSAISYMHSNNIAHRDLKFENIMFESKHPEAAIKVIDFGLSKEYSPNNHILTERVGTLYSMSPETLQGIYTNQADLWSIGVCTYMMLAAGDKPFEGKTPKQLVAKILMGKYDFEAEVWKDISPGAISFIHSLLVVQPENRSSATDAMRHGWLTHATRQNSDHSSVDDNFRQRVKQGIIRYSNLGDFRKLALNVVAKKSTSAEIFEIRKVFEEFDTNNTGTITLPEFKAALEHFDYSEGDLMEIFRKVDVNKNNVINFTEFVAACIETQGQIEEHRLGEAFDFLDCDDSGYISKKNLRHILGERCNDQYIDCLIREADFRKDGQISYEDFLQIFAQDKQVLASAIYENVNESNREMAFSTHSEEEVLQKFGLIGNLRRGITSASNLLTNGGPGSRRRLHSRERRSNHFDSRERISRRRLSSRGSSR
jgi:calcium-dependent protein kinase